jgi:REP element-mobilizing transposase RayT
LYIHLVWTTRNREPSLDAWSARFLSTYLQTVARQERCHLLALGIVRTHLHVLLAIHPLTLLPKLVQRMKGGSATVSNREGHGKKAVRWAKGYNIETVSPRSLGDARRYVAEQATHHPAEAIRGWDGFVHEEYDPDENRDPASSTSRELDSRLGLAAKSGLGSRLGGYQPPLPSSGS